MQRQPADTLECELPHAAGRLFQQYIVDAYAKVESQRLNWVVQNQGKLRVESMQGLLDHLNGANDETTLRSVATEVPSDYQHKEQVQNVGKPIILPATFGGSPRALHEQYLDSMCLVSHYGKPDVFLTCTANPNWPV